MSRIFNNPGPEEKFFLLSNAFARDSRVTTRAARVYIYLRSHRTGWDTNVRRIAEAIGMGKNAVNSAINDLEKLGYVERRQALGEDGLFGEMEYVTHAEPCTQNRDTDGHNRVPETGNRSEQDEQDESTGHDRYPNLGNPDLGNPKTGTHKKTNSKGNQGQEDQENTCPSDDGRADQPPLIDPFDQWWPHVPRKVSKGDARIAFKAALKKTDLQTLIDGINRSAQQWKREKRSADKIPYPATWLRAESWLDELPNAPEQTAPSEQSPDEDMDILDIVAMIESKEKRSA